MNAALEAIWLNIVSHIESDDCQAKFLTRIPAKINCRRLFDRLAKYSDTIIQIQFLILIKFGQRSSVLRTHFSFVTAQTSVNLKWELHEIISV